MRVVFTQRIWRELLAAMSLSAHLKAHGHHTSAAVAQDLDKLVQRTLAHRPDVVAIYWVSDDTVFHSAFIRRLKQQAPGLRVVAGGPHPTHNPELIESVPLDALCRGEGEAPLLEYVEALAVGREPSGIANLWLRGPDGALARNDIRPLQCELGRLSGFDRELYRDYRVLSTNPHKSFMAGRGCPYRCTFCFTPVLHDLYERSRDFVRWRQADEVLGEILYCKRHQGLRSVRFEDDTFSMDRSWLFPFLRRYAREVALPFVCYVRADQVDDELARELKAAGCHMVCFGVETGDEQTRLRLLRKGIKDAHLYNAARVLHAHGVGFYTTNMLALPGEDLERSWKTVHINQELRPRDVWSSVFQPYPGIPITERAIEMGIVSREDVERQATRIFQENTFLQSDARAQFNLHKLFLLAVKAPRLEPLIRRWIHLPPNALNRAVSMAASAYGYRNHAQVSLARVAWEGAHLVRFFGSRSAEY